jgi:seryl-tRNA synthetase
MRTAKQLAAILAATFLVMGVAFAQTQRGGGAVNAQLMQQYQQLATERTQLQADNAKLKKDLDDLKKQLDAAKHDLASSKTGASRTQAEVATLQASNEATTKQLEDARSKMQELVARFRETVTSLRNVEGERTQVQQDLAQSRAAYDKCAQTNAALYQVTGEVLDRYQHQGAFSYLERAEPFTRLKRTQIENLALEYKQRADELRVKKEDATAAAKAPGPPVTATSPASAHE